jgi:hypothetical protein
MLNNPDKIRTNLSRRPLHVHGGQKISKFTKECHLVFPNKALKKLSCCI